MEITDAKYQELLADQQKARTLEAENAKMKETAENTKVALKANRDEIAQLKTEKETVTKEFETFKAEKEVELKKLENFDDLKSKAEKFEALEAEKAEARKKWIEDMKTKLWEEFLKANKSFLDGLPEDKVETFLKIHADKLDGWKQDVNVWTNSNWMNNWAWTQHTTQFDTALQKGDVMWALASIPSPVSK